MSERGLSTDRLAVNGPDNPQAVHGAPVAPARLAVIDADRPRTTHIGFALSAGGYVFTGVLLYVLLGSGIFGFPGTDALIWDRVGDEIRAGVSPYYTTTVGYGFYYAPPWAVALALVSWLPPTLTAIAVSGLEVLALRYIAGSWLRAGYLCWFPLVAFELAGSQWNLVMAAAIAGAIRGVPEAAAVMAAAKLSPLLAIDPRQWRRVLPIAVVLVVSTLPWWHLWPDWLGLLTATYGTSISAVQINIPLLPRLALAVALVLSGRPWARGLAAIIATPALYWVSSVLLFALIPTSRVAWPKSGTAPRRPRRGPTSCATYGKGDVLAEGKFKLVK